MNIVTAATEAAGIAKAGGLADVISALNKEWAKAGHNNIIILPKYRYLDCPEGSFKPTDITLIVPMGNWTEFARLWQGTLPETNIPVYLIEHNVYFDRNGIYGESKEYPDNDRRFIFFSRAIMETCKALNFKPDVIHAHDFHTAFTMAFLKTHYRDEPLFQKTAGVYTIHNLAYQGKFDPMNSLTYAGYDRGAFYIGSWFEQFGVVNAMKVGIMFADKITTVSPTYSKEIRLDYYSEGLRDELNIRAADLIGILNGPDYDVWSPKADKFIYKNYSIDTLKDKTINKFELLKDFGLTNQDNLEKPLFGMVTRLTEQKGIDLIIEVIERFIAKGDFRLVLLGSGAHKYESFFNYMNEKYPKDVLIRIGYDNMLSHRIFAASDYYLMPSRYEPCGLTQLYSMKYGTLPIVRITGGLADTVEEYSESNQTGTGFRFYKYEGIELDYAIGRALEIYQKEYHWNRARMNSMERNFTSEESAKKYLEVFNWALEAK
ncbi:MAG: glycogen synthase [bacterium]